MTAEALFTLREVARRLQVPESTVRYYRDAFAAYLPTVGTGRRRLYPASAVKAFRVIAKGFANREERGVIEASLIRLGESAVEPNTAVTISTSTDGQRGLEHDVVSAILDGERERREAMWQMAREMYRLGEAIERQQVLLHELAERVAAADRALPSSTQTPDARPDGQQVTSGTDELARLREELERERELVERLRRSKLDIERRAAEAEARLEPLAADGGRARKSLLDRLLLRE